MLLLSSSSWWWWSQEYNNHHHPPSLARNEGIIGLLLGLAVFIYYILWVVITPFYDGKSGGIEDIGNTIHTGIEPTTTIHSRYSIIIIKNLSITIKSSIPITSKCCYRNTSSYRDHNVREHVLVVMSVVVVVVIMWYHHHHHYYLSCRYLGYIFIQEERDDMKRDDEELITTRRKKRRKEELASFWQQLESTSRPREARGGGGGGYDSSINNCININPEGGGRSKSE